MGISHSHAEVKAATNLHTEHGDAPAPDALVQRSNRRVIQTDDATPERDSPSVVRLRTFRQERAGRMVERMETASPRIAPKHLGPARRVDGPGHCPVSSSREGGESKLRIDGPFDALTVRDINPALEAVVAERPKRVTVDLAQVWLMDSTGVSAILSLWRRVKEHGGQVVVVHAHDQPLAVIKVLKLDAVFGM